MWRFRRGSPGRVARDGRLLARRCRMCARATSPYGVIGRHRNGGGLCPDCTRSPLVKLGFLTEEHRQKKGLVSTTRWQRGPLPDEGTQRMDQGSPCGEGFAPRRVDCVPCVALSWSDEGRRWSLGALRRSCGQALASEITANSCTAHIASGRYKPLTMNTDLSVLRVVMARAKLELDLLHNPMAAVEPFDTSQHPHTPSKNPTRSRLMSSGAFFAGCATRSLATAR
jgi:hypothetical protein